ncbi:nitrate reductase molybdenum cofactor assembly chaperone [Nostocoides sp.]|jgi:nitrate reductase delta subunit|uniref:nitrate reductase molybdenum cofactor assembly chaperone n=1 Tax=Nostocoides sp. TaxID=1917966 RepID=UPI002B606878|nr:nitrate reductase molybdenum cofactor assembly chaperone [Tetrasphaera sp.]
MMWRRHRRSTPTLSRTDIRTLWQCSSLLLDYPTEERVGQIPALRAALDKAPVAAAAGLTAYLDYVATTPLEQVQSEYVDTFDVTRRCALHLTYYTCGDTRKRGVELIRVKQAYRSAGFEVTQDELPDHLAVVLEFGAMHDLDIAWKLLCDHRVGIELLQRALSARRSPWLGVLEAVRATLPALDGTDEEALAALIAQGPPSEQVGLELPGYALDPRLNPRPEPIDLGTTIAVRASA